MSDLLIHQQQPQMDLNAHEEEYRQELEQEGCRQAELACPEPEPEPVSLVPPPQICRNCFYASTMTKPHRRHAAHSGSTTRRRLSSSNPIVATSGSENTSAAAPFVPLPPKTQQQIEQDDLEFTLRGFSKITLPENHRCSGVWNITSGSPEKSSSSVPFFSKAATPPPALQHQNQHGFSPSKPASPLPPLPPPLRRTSSDPTPAINYSNVEESPNSRRLKRMRHQLKEMSRWWHQVLREEEEEEDEVPGEQNNNATEKDGAEAENDQESVSVEELGDCLSIHFNCPCGKGYQILLSGRNCYYKLI
ncbi:hypothetical protein CDL15_Pgr006314 [Punica granatum]|uniref:Uncharacterized protein n=1 Tax=Punica granatum TaxID=22663 RepID=A0A218WAX3_PUNGR|nr:hypothetical protein CDL15_Pgr006314 [Punica granatum]